MACHTRNTLADVLNKEYLPLAVVSFGASTKKYSRTNAINSNTISEIADVYVKIVAFINANKSITPAINSAPDIKNAVIV